MRLLNLEPSNFDFEAIDKLSEVAEIKNLSNPSFVDVEDFDGILVKLDWNIDRHMINMFPNLKFIATPTTGLTHINTAYCEEKGIKIISLKGEAEFLKDIWSTAEHTIGLILAITRKVSLAFINHGENRRNYIGMGLRHKSIAIIGNGRVGKQVGELAGGLGMFVARIDLDTSVEDRLGCYQVADIVSLHVDEKPENRNMINKYIFNKMKTGAYFINTSRGSMVNEDDLINALQSEKLTGAAIDVWKNEHDSDYSSQLFDYSRHYPEKLIITPHIAGNTKESIKKTDMFIVDKIIKEYNLL